MPVERTPVLVSASAIALLKVYPRFFFDSETSSQVCTHLGQCDKSGSGPAGLTAEKSSSLHNGALGEGKFQVLQQVILVVGSKLCHHRNSRCG